MNALIDRSVLIGVTLVDRIGTEVDRFEIFGTVEVVDHRWIGVRREGFSELFGLPPAPELFEPAADDVYTLQSRGEQVVDPDYLVSLTVTVVDPESVLAIRGLGFEPSDQ